MKEGWIPFYRSTIYEPVFDDCEVFKVWLWLLLKTSHEDKTEVCKKIKVELKSGMVLVKSRQWAAKELNLSERKYRTAINLLEKMGYISVHANNKFTIINVIKWRYLDPHQHKNDQQMTNECPVDDRQMSHPNINKNNININNIYNNKSDIDYKAFEIRALKKRIERWGIDMLES